MSATKTGAKLVHRPPTNAKLQKLVDALAKSSGDLAAYTAAAAAAAICATRAGLVAILDEPARSAVQDVLQYAGVQRVCR
jgi:hypothetical protein